MTRCLIEMNHHVHIVYLDHDDQRPPVHVPSCVTASPILYLIYIRVCIVIHVIVWTIVSTDSLLFTILTSLKENKIFLYSIPGNAS